MRKVTYSLSISLDGYIVGPDGGFQWSEPDAELFRFATDEVRELGVHLLGRRLYESMQYWSTPEAVESPDPDLAEFGAIWRALPKVVWSRTLNWVEGNARLASAGLAEEIARLRDESDVGNIAIGGATLAAAASELGLIDEYRIRVYPILVGGGIPYFPRADRRVDLELVDTRTFDCGVVFLHHRVRR
jgi:dihydrofolate reductase